MTQDDSPFTEIDYEESDYIEDEERGRESDRRYEDEHGITGTTGSQFATDGERAAAVLG